MWTSLDLAYKILLGKRETSSEKYHYEEVGDSTLDIYAADIKSISPAYNDPATSVTDGIVQAYTLFVLTKDTSVSGDQCYYTKESGNRIKDWVSDRFGDAYRVRLFDNNDTEIFPTDELDWLFNYKTGILTINGDTSGSAKPYKITGYRYINTFGASLISNLAYDATTWLGDTTIAPSKNAVRNEFENRVPKISDDILFNYHSTSGFDITNDGNGGDYSKGFLYLSSSDVRVGWDNSWLNINGGSVSFNINGETISLPNGVSGTVALVEGLGEYVLKVTDGIQFDFYSSDSLGLTNDNGNFTKSWLYYTSLITEIGFGSSPARTSLLFDGSTAIFKMGTQVISVPTGADGTLALTSDLSGYVQKLTGNVLFNFSNPSTLELTTDNGGYAESWLYMNYGTLDFGYGSSYINIGSGSDIKLASIIDSTSTVNIKTGVNSFFAQLAGTNLTADRDFEFPDASGTLALTSDLGPYIQKITGDIQFSFDSASHLGITSDSNNYLQSWIRLDSTYLQLGFDGTRSITMSSGRLAISSGGFEARLSTSTLSDNRDFQFPDSSGTLALISNINIRFGVLCPKTNREHII